MMNIKYGFLLAIAMVLLVVSCDNNPQVPKPRGYFRIEFPEHEYKKYEDDCPFIFEIPIYSFIVKEKGDNCWMDIYFPANRATIYLTYKSVNNDLAIHLDDSREFVYKHTVKADAIEEIRFENDSLKVYGMFYNLKGNTATSIQFFLTDSTNHFLRGSMYFDVAPNKDSLAPVVDFLREDIVHLMETFQWK